MEKTNYEDSLNKLALEKARKAAQSLDESWKGLGETRPSSAGSYVDGIKKTVLNESNGTVTPKASIYTLGLSNTLLALRNTSLYDLPEAKIMLEKYLNALNIKGGSEAYLLESFLKDLSTFSWENNAKSALTNLTKVYENNVREIMVLKTIHDLRNSGGRELFVGLSEALTNWVMSPTRVTESLLLEMKPWSFSPAIKNLIHNVTILEGNNSNTLSIRSENSNCDVKRIVVPSMVTESYTIHAINGRFIKVGNGKLKMMERQEVSKLPSKFLNAVLALNEKEVRINDNGVDFLTAKTKVSVVFENKEKNIYLNGKKISESTLGTALSMEFRNLLGHSAGLIEKVMKMVKYSDYLSELDFGKSIKSKVYEGVEINLFKVGKKVYVQKVNPSMRQNEIFEANGNQTVNMVKDFIGFDISESFTEFLEGENKIKSIMYNDKKIIKQNMALVESELSKLEVAIKNNPLLANSEEILAAKDMLTNESEVLKSRWNEINIEIERFEKGSKKISVNEKVGYGLDTPVKLRKNGAKGVIIGVNGNSKTYTVMMENGSTGEYFFNDVVNTADEIKNVNITVSEAEINDPKTMNLAKLAFKESTGNTEGPTGVSGKSQMADHLKDKNAGNKDVKGVSGDSNMAKAPGGNAKSGSKYINKEETMKLAKLPSSSSKSSTKKEVDDDDKEMNLSETPKSKIKRANNSQEGTSAGKVSESKVQQKNTPLAKAPGKSASKGKTFIEAPSKSNLAKAPKGTSKTVKKFGDMRKANLSSAPGNKGKTKGNTTKMLDGKVKKSK